MPDVVVGVALDQAGLCRQHGHRPVAGLVWDFSVTHGTIAFSVGATCNPQMSIVDDA